MNPICHPIYWKLQKNKHLIDSLILLNAPKFVYSSSINSLRGEIPVFTYHLAIPDLFEKQCRFLAENNYNTLSADEFLLGMTSGDRSLKKSIVLTFDDGLKQVWTVAFPILKKYGLKAICFLVPGSISDTDMRIRPTLDDFWQGRASLAQIIKMEAGSASFATWPEIKRMHSSGIVDFQSHTLYHSLVFTSDKIFDIVNPKYNPHAYGNFHIPIYKENGRDVVDRKPLPGLPVYYAKPRMSAERRFYDDESIRSMCFETVNKEGSDAFFKKKNWRKKLYKKIKKAKKNKSSNEKWEDQAIRDKEVFEELYKSKKIIEKQLPGKKVTHLCFPWYEAKRFAVIAAQKAGFKACYFGTVKNRPTNHPGDSLLSICRIEDLFVERLPGVGRKSLKSLLKTMWSLKNITEYTSLQREKKHQ